MPSHIRICAAILLSVVAVTAQANVRTGQAAPHFTAIDALSNTEISLADFRNKTVVLEWVNYGCPFVKKHYSAGNMQRLQADADADNVVWISINSSAKGKQGYLAAEEVAVEMATRGAKNRYYIRDETGTIGQAYGAKTTPHMYVINAEGTLVYQGAIDDNRSADPATIQGATNYITAALHALSKGAPVKPHTTQPYGCSVKYSF
jgi:peroxiredoxin